MKAIIDNGILRAAIDSKGCELVSLKGPDGFEYIWQGSEEYWEGHSPMLFPVCGRMTGLEYTYDGKKYPMPPHGFLGSMDTVLAGGSTRCAEFLLKSSEETKKYWPFDFVLRTSFGLNERTLEVSAEVLNLSDVPMPFSFGGHPGFNLPMDDGLCFEDYSVKFDDGVTPAEMQITPDGYVGPETYAFPLENSALPLRHGLFEIEGRFLRGAGHTAVLSSEKGSRSVKMTFPFADVLGLWHAAGTDAPYVCIEPWAGSPDRQGVPCDLLKKADMITVMPGKSAKCVYTITV